MVFEPSIPQYGIDPNERQQQKLYVFKPQIIHGAPRWNDFGVPPPPLETQPHNSTLQRNTPYRAVEIDRDRFDLLKGNVRKSAGTATSTPGRVLFFNANFLKLLETERQRLAVKRPVVFLDPPWGGVSYKKQVGGSRYQSFPHDHSVGLRSRRLRFVSR